MKNWEKYREIVAERPQLFTDEGLRVILDEAEIAEFEKTSGREIGVLYQSPYRYVLVDLVENAEGKRFAYERVVPVRVGGAAILPMYGEMVVLVREYRHAVQRWCWEIPRGFGYAGATASQNAKKELREETGISECRISWLGQMMPDSGLTADQIDIFLAEVEALELSTVNAEETEEIASVRAFPLDEVFAMIAKGEIQDSFTLAALAMWQWRQ